jgi:uncharacterized NAD(P)/FAD-binding protein YdhS
MLAVHLLRRGARVTLFERRREPGRGLAYGAADPIHLLNVRAGNMSAYPDDPGHFAAWLEARGIGNAAAQFAPRRSSAPMSRSSSLPPSPPRPAASSTAAKASRIWRPARRAP